MPNAVLMMASTVIGFLVPPDGPRRVTVQWVLSAYTAAFALGLVTSGRLGDLLGRRRLFLLGMTGFTLASLACGLAPDMVFLIVARTLQGLCGSVMIPQGLALMTVVFSPRHLRKALTPVGPLMGLATVAGPILAGWLLHLDLFGSQWRSIFLINIPFGIIAAALGWRVLPRRGGENPAARLDVTGVGLLTAASALLIIPLIQGRHEHRHLGAVPRRVHRGEPGARSADERPGRAEGLALAGAGVPHRSGQARNYGRTAWVFAVA
jgi:MFS family permease